MQEVSNKVYKTMAILLQYPNKDLLHCVPELESYTGLMPAGKAQRVIENFLGYLKSEPMLKLQQNYTAAFDMNPSTTLNMTYHLFGEGEKRAGMMGRLQQCYYAAGYDGPANDLPDFLPLMLEFLALCPDPSMIDLFWQCCAALDGLIERLREMTRPYADLLDLLADDYKQRFITVVPQPPIGVSRSIKTTLT
jgi:nitrate reductase delta subunit